MSPFFVSLDRSQAIKYPILLTLNSVSPLGTDAPPGSCTFHSTFVFLPSDYLLADDQPSIEDTGPGLPGTSITRPVSDWLYAAFARGLLTTCRKYRSRCFAIRRPCLIASRNASGS